MNIPNILTLIRFVLIPVFGYYLYIGEFYVAVALFLAGGLTDVLDGLIARRFNMVTSLGKLADPLADKLMQITALVLLTIQHRIPILVILIVIAKEGLMGAGSVLLLKRRNYVVSANWYGKMATVVFYIAIVASIVNEQFNIFSEMFSNIFIGIAVLATLFAFLMYYLSFIRINKTLNSEQ